MNKHKLKCATCGDNLKLKGQIVSCAKCKRKKVPVHSGTLAAAILTIESQAQEDGRTLDVTSLGADGKGDLTYSFVEMPDEVTSEDSDKSARARKRFA